MIVAQVGRREACHDGLQGEPVGVQIPGYLDGSHRPIRQIGLEVV
jgi:hypothetical protein